MAAGARVWADRVGVWASAMCVVHCVVTPVVVGASPLLAHVLPGEEATHRTLAVMVALLGAVALMNGLRRHRRWRVAGMFAGGVGLIAAAASLGDRLPGRGWEIGVTLCGSGLMIAAHRLNHTFCRACECAVDRGCSSDTRHRGGRG